MKLYNIGNKRLNQGKPIKLHKYLKCKLVKTFNLKITLVKDLHNSHNNSLVKIVKLLKMIKFIQIKIFNKAQQFIHQ